MKYENSDGTPNFQNLKNIDIFFSNNNFPSKNSSTSILSRKICDSQIFSGNIGIDFTNPIYEGSFVRVKDSNSQDNKSYLLFSSIFQLNPDTHFIFFSPKNANVEKIASFFNSDDNSQKLENRLNFLVLKNETKEELILATKLLFASLNDLKNRGKKVVLILDDFSTIFHKFFNLYHYTKNEVFLKESFGICQKYTFFVRNLQKFFLDSFFTRKNYTKCKKFR